MSETAKPANLLLAALPDSTYRQMSPRLERVELNYRERLYSPGEPYTHVYFVESGIVSILIGDGEDAMIEVAMVGSEGMAALPVFFGVDTSNHRALVQGQGVALRMAVSDFVAAFNADGDLSRILRSFASSMMIQVERAAVCSRYHAIDSRLARWLLMTQDRMRSEDFQLTHGLLSPMLGVRREAVSKAATTFQKRSLISYRRGSVRILDRAGLENTACTCYRIQMVEPLVFAQSAKKGGMV